MVAEIVLILALLCQAMAFRASSPSSFSEGRAQLLFITCCRKDLKVIVEEYSDYLLAFRGMELLQYGELQKTPATGFMLFAIHSSIPTNLMTKLHNDTGIHHFVLLDPDAKEAQP